MSWRILRLVCAGVVLLAGAVPACGGNASDPHLVSGGSAGSGAHAGSGLISRGGSSGRGPTAGAGTAGTPGSMPVTCGTESCAGVTIPIPGITIPGCCADAETSHCGLDSSALAEFGPMFAEACQPLAQPGTADATCPESASVPVQGGFEISLPGCCRADHTCGYLLDNVAIFQVGLGCVDSAPFLDGGAPQSCGAAGTGGDGGAGGDSGAVSPGAAGDSSSAGAAGANNR